MLEPLTLIFDFVAGILPHRHQAQTFRFAVLQLTIRCIPVVPGPPLDDGIPKDLFDDSRKVRQLKLCHDDRVVKRSTSNTSARIVWTWRLGQLIAPFAILAQSVGTLYLIIIRCFTVLDEAWLFLDVFSRSAAVSGATAAVLSLIIIPFKDENEWIYSTLLSTLCRTPHPTNPPAPKSFVRNIELSAILLSTAPSSTGLSTEDEKVSGP